MVEFLGNRLKFLLFVTYLALVTSSNFCLPYVYADELTIQPGAEDGKDSYISTWGGDQSKNFGDSEDIYVGYSDYKRGLLQFDLSSIPPNASISSAELYLYLKGSLYDFHNTEIYVHRITRLWKEEEVTWKERYQKQRWDSQGGDFDWSIESSVSPMHRSSEWVCWGVTGIVKDWVNGKYDNFGFLLRQDMANRKENRFLSSDTPWREYRPRLVISYELEEHPPEPISLPVKVYPNPFKPAKGHTEVKFINLPSGAKVKIFSIEGSIVRTLEEKSGKAEWDVRDGEGEKLSSGFYLYLIETERERYSGKIVIIR
jgi:hypothetical protein